MIFSRSFKEIRNMRTYTWDDAEFAKLLGVEDSDLSNDKMKEATYWACMRILCDSISSLPLKLYKESNEGTVIAREHYLYNLLKLRPNKLMSSSTFWKVVEFNRNEYGHSIVYIDTQKTGRNAGKVLGLYPFDMNSISILVDDKGILGRTNSIWYIYSDNSGKEYKLTNDEVLHFFGMTNDGIQGMAVKDYLRTIIENSQSGQGYINKYFKGGLFAKGILTYTGDISPENQVKMKERFERMATGIKNSGSILPVPLGFDFKTINTSMSDAQFLQLNQLSVKQIANGFGIKSHQLNDLERSTHTNIEHQQRDFYVSTLMSILNMYEQELTYKLLLDKEISKGYFFRFNVDAILRGNFMDQINALSKAVGSGLYTPNEGRDKLDLPRKEGGDILITNGNSIPMTMVGQQYRKGGGRANE